MIIPSMTSSISNFTNEYPDIDPSQLDCTMIWDRELQDWIHNDERDLDNSIDQANRCDDLEEVDVTDFSTQMERETLSSTRESFQTCSTCLQIITSNHTCVPCVECEQMVRY